MDEGKSLSLRQLGWSGFFAAQIDPAAEQAAVPARVFGVQRHHVNVMTEAGPLESPVGGRWYQQGAEGRPTIGDWLLVEQVTGTIVRLLTRKSLLKRTAVGREREVQLMAANVDTMFLVSACNEEFNPSRMERYLALALDAGVEPVVVLTKADKVEAPEAYADPVRALKRDLVVEVVDARDPATLAGVRAWCVTGQTVALLGSSGVGKSTLVNSLSGSAVQQTGEARAEDDKGRHTTTARSLHLLPDGGLLVDNPGMRELSLADVDVSGSSLFEDIEALAARCRFRDCRHEAEPGCAVQAALQAGTLDQRRLDSFRKLAREEAYALETKAESRARTRAWGRYHRKVQDEREKRGRDD